MAFYLIEKPDDRARFMRMMEAQQKENPMNATLQRALKGDPEGVMRSAGKAGLEKLLAAYSLLLAVGINVEDLLMAAVEQFEEDEAEGGNEP